MATTRTMLSGCGRIKTVVSPSFFMFCFVVLFVVCQPDVVAHFYKCLTGAPMFADAEWVLKLDFRLF